MTRQIYTVTNAAGAEWTIIAESPEEAEEIAREAHCSDDSDKYEIEKDYWPWVRYHKIFDSEADANRQVEELLRVGVEPNYIQRRHTTDTLNRSLLWEISATGEDWCRLPSGVFSKS